MWDEVRLCSGADGTWAMLDWAFCGNSRVTPPSNEHGISKPEHSAWQHWIDSKSTTPDPDEGDMFPQEDGDVLERGWQKDSSTGGQVEYEELWGDMPILAIKNSYEDHQSVRRCVVLRCENDRQYKGLVIRVGQYIQGMMRSSEGIRIERWEWHPVSDGMDGLGTWEKTLILGKGSMPCRQTIKKLDMQVGDHIHCGKGQWTLVENLTW